MAILGESGSGKSVTAQAIMGILDTPPARIAGGSIRLQGTELIGLPEDEYRQIRGRQIAMIFQDALSALNPVSSVGDQISEMFRIHQGLGKKDVPGRRHRGHEAGEDPGCRTSASATTRTSSPAACASAS